jgi:hypothetical protein
MTSTELATPSGGTPRPRRSREPSAAELREFALALVGPFGDVFDAAVVDEAIRENHALWLMLYRADRREVPR